MISAQRIQYFVSSIKYLVFYFFLFSIFYFLYSLANPAPVNAQTNSPLTSQQTQQTIANPYTVPETNPDVPKNLHTWTQNVMIEVIAAMNCQLIGIDTINPDAKCLGVDQKTGKIGFMQNGGGAVGVMSNMISMLFTPPFRTSDYIRYVASTFGIVQPAYAQGIGFMGLTPLVSLWSAFRNIVYLIYILIFVIIGLAIVLRIKIDPRTVMSIQNQIPKIIISMLLVTFSFAIAGFLIDLMYVSTYLSYNVINNAAQNMLVTPKPDLTELNPAVTQGKTVFGAVGGMGSVFSISGTGANAIKAIIVDFLDIDHGLLDLISPIHISLTPPDISIGFPVWDGWSLFDFIIDTASLYAAFLGSLVGSGALQSGLPTASVGGLAGAALGYVAAQSALREVLPFAIGFLIIFIALIWALFKLWFALIKAYIYILVDTVIAPFWIVLGLFPSNETITFETWIRDLLANLSAFPVTLIMFLLGKVFIDTFNGSAGRQPLFVPPFIGDPSITGPIGSLIGIGVILMTPQVVEIMKSVFKSPQIKFTAAVGQALGVGSPTGLVGSASQLGTTYFGLSHLGGALKGLMGKRGGSS